MAISNEALGLVLAMLSDCLHPDDRPTMHGLVVTLFEKSRADEDLSPILHDITTCMTAAFLNAPDPERLRAAMVNLGIPLEAP